MDSLKKMPMDPLTVPVPAGVSPDELARAIGTFIGLKCNPYRTTQRLMTVTVARRRRETPAQSTKPPTSGHVKASACRKNVCEHCTFELSRFELMLATQTLGSYADAADHGSVCTNSMV
jgi:hypothetical protein